MKIWLVQGMTGDYSDRDVWIVAAYTDAKAAQLRAQALDERVRCKQYLDYDERHKAQQAIRADPRGDPYCRIVFPGTNYSVEKCELFDARGRLAKKHCEVSK